MDQREFSIGEFSKKTGMSIRNLRYYDEIGLLVPEKHPTSGHRIYNYKDIITLQKILSLKFLGYSLDKISELLDESSFTVDLSETLTLHYESLEEEKNQIEKSMDALKRVIRLLKEEGELDSDLLFSLVHALPTEDREKEWMERHELTGFVEQISKKVEESVDLERTFVQLTKKVKQLYGKPINDPEVQEMFKSYIEATTSSLGEDFMQTIGNINVGQQEIQEFEELFPSPFTESEQKWLMQAIEYYMEQSEIKW